MRSLTALTLVLFCVSHFGCGNQSIETSSDASVPSLNAKEQVVKASFNPDGAPTIAFNVPGMHCSSCAGSICETLEEVAGVIDIETDVNAKTATVAIDKESFDPSVAIEALSEAAFTNATLMATAVNSVADPLIVMEEESDADSSPATKSTDEASEEAGEE